MVKSPDELTLVYISACDTCVGFTCLSIVCWEINLYSPISFDLIIDKIRFTPHAKHHNLAFLGKYGRFEIYRRYVKPKNVFPKRIGHSSDIHDVLLGA